METLLYVEFGRQRGSRQVLAQPTDLFFSHLIPKCRQCKKKKHWENVKTKQNQLDGAHASFFLGGIVEIHLNIKTMEHFPRDTSSRCSLRGLVSHSFLDQFHARRQLNGHCTSTTSTARLAMGLVGVT